MATAFFHNKYPNCSVRKVAPNSRIAFTKRAWPEDAEVEQPKTYQRYSQNKMRSVTGLTKLMDAEGTDADADADADAAQTTAAAARVPSVWAADAHVPDAAAYGPGAACPLASLQAGAPRDDAARAEAEVGGVDRGLHAA